MHTLVMVLEKLKNEIIGKMNNGEKHTKDYGVIILFIILTIIFLPITILLAPFEWLRSLQFKKEYEEYLRQIDGKNFFCYNNRRKGYQFIKEEILPFLPEEVEPIFLNGKKIETDTYRTKFLSNAFYSFKNYTRFPQLLKVRNGEAIDCSINSELFLCLNQGKDNELIFNKINDFFELKKTHHNKK